MDAHFSIAIEPDVGLVRIAMGGFFVENDISSFTNDLETKMRALRCLPNQHVMICDITDMKIQAQEIVGMFARIVGHPKFRSRRLAFVTGSSLSRMQARRLTDRPGVQFFSDPTAAERWLLERDAS